MSTETSQAPALGDDQFGAAIEWRAAFIGILLQAQQRRLQVLASWQGSMAPIGQDQWDRWVCRVGGGVPLDG